MSGIDIKEVLSQLGVKNEVNKGASTGENWIDTKGDVIDSFTPVDGSKIGQVKLASVEDYNKAVDVATSAFYEWRQWTAPARGEIVRQIGQKLREFKEPLGKLVSYEMGKVYQEGLGEVQEMIDICDFAVGLSRQLYGLTMHSERPHHRMYEQWHPLGPVGIITAFNFPVAVWSWNAMIAWVCGDTCIWKPSEKTPLCSIACQQIVSEVFRKNNVPEGVSCIVNGDYRIGDKLARDPRVALVSATGSTRMGKAVASTVAARLGRVL